MVSTVKRLSNSSRHLLRDSRSTRPTAATKSSTSLAIYPVTFSVTTSGTEPHGRVITGVPHANRFDHGQAERLRPIDREQQSQRAPEKFVLLRSVVSLAQLSGVVFPGYLTHLRSAPIPAGRPSCARRVSFKAGSVPNDIVSAQDWLPTLLAAAGEPDVN
jgi:hypothetical protein